MKTLRLNDDVNRVLLGGPLTNVSGKAEAKFHAGRLGAATGNFVFTGLEGSELKFEKALATAELEAGGAFGIRWQADTMLVRNHSILFRALEPAFFGRELPEWITGREVDVHALVPPGGGLHWSQAKAEFDGGKLKLASTGAFDRDRTLTGQLMADYPLIKKLKWRLDGTTASPEVTDDSVGLAELRRRPVIDEAILGLPAARSIAEEAAPGGLKALSEKVMRRARGLMPNQMPSEKSEMSQSSKATDSSDRTK